MAKPRKSFPFYFDYADWFAKLLTNEQVGRLLYAMVKYADQGIITDFDKSTDPQLAAAFIFVQTQLDRDRAAYEEKCKRNADNGMKGGRPPSAAVQEAAQNKNPFADCVRG